MRSPIQLLIALLAMAVPCAARAGAPSARVVRFGELTPGLPTLIPVVAERNGYFAARGLSVQVRHFDGGPQAIAAAAAGEIDLGSVGTPVLIGAVRGVPIRIVASPAATRNPFVLVGAPAIRRIEDLRGKRVGVSSVGGGNRQALAWVVASRGLGLRDLQLVGIGGGSAVGYAALQAGRVDAIMTSEPWATRIEVGGAGRILATAADHFGRYQHQFLFGTRGFLDRQPEVVRAFLAAYREAVVWAKTHPDAFTALAVRELQLEEPVARRVLARDLPAWNDTGRVDLEGTRNAIRILKEIGDLDASLPVDVPELVDPRFGAL